MTITHDFAIVWFVIFILITSYSRLMRYQILEENLDLSDEDVDMVMEVIQEDKIDLNITTTAYRNATVTKGTFTRLKNDSEDLSITKFI